MFLFFFPEQNNIKLKSVNAKYIDVNKDNIWIKENLKNEVEPRPSSSSPMNELKRSEFLLRHSVDNIFRAANMTRSKRGRRRR